MKKENTLLKDGAFYKKKYVKLLISAAIVWCVSLVDSYTDSLAAGILINDSAVAALGLLNPLQAVDMFTAFLVSWGSSILYSKEIGAYNYDKAYKYFGQGVILSFIFGLAMVGVMAALKSQFIRFYNPSPEVVKYINEYYFAEYMYALIFPIYNLLNQTIIIDGDEIIPAVGNLVMAVLNIVLSILLAKPYGVKGLAYGTIIGTIACVFVFCIHFFKKTNSVHFKLYFSLKDTLTVFKYSSMSAFTLLSSAIFDIAINKLIISNYSDAFIPAYTILNFVNCLGSIFASTYDASSGFVTIACGENNPFAIKKIMKIAIKAALIESVIVFVAVNLVAQTLPKLVGITDPEIFNYTVKGTQIISISFPVMALFYLFCPYYPSVGKVSLGNFASIYHLLICPGVLCLILSNVIGFNGIAVGISASGFVVVISLIIFILLKNGKKSFPYLLDETDEECLSYDVLLTTENISSLCTEVKKELDLRKISSVTSNKIQLVIEESFMSELEENKGKKVFCECNILISDKTIRLITRDNGKIVDITDMECKIKNLRGYVLSRILIKNKEINHVPTMSFNRNTYVWNLD